MAIIDPADDPQRLELIPEQVLKAKNALSDPADRAAWLESGGPEQLLEIIDIFKFHFENTVDFSEECRFDHHGYCQNHMDFYINAKTNPLCYVEKAKIILDKK